MASTNQPQMMATTTPEQNLPVVPKENNENKIIQSVRTPLEQTLTSINENDAYYTVQEKDTLFSIAKKFNTTVATLKSLNQLELDTIKIGQQLKTK
ncbi:MAG: LysM peptidoglycan-binding domain-containing protein [Saprospiraceae bacterium]|nr:LysM peptidoglycan-binding domain-containing protein [Saprospiraceae bacterium]